MGNVSLPMVTQGYSLSFLVAMTINSFMAHCKTLCKKKLGEQDICLLGLPYQNMMVWLD
jgi:hypothetical protein